MTAILLKPERSDALYQGFYSDLAFNLLANPVPLYRNFLKQLGKFGANLNGLRIDTTTLAEANLSCYLQELNVFVVCRIDRVDVTCAKLHELSPDIAGQLLTDTWAAVHDSDDSLCIARHVVTTNIYNQIVGITYDEIVSRFVKAPDGISGKHQAGVVFYLSDDYGEGSIVLDRLPGQKQGLIIKLNVGFDANKLALADLVNHTQIYLDGRLNSLGLELEK
jgi:hypothetical protein